MTADQYPYIASSTRLAAMVVPDWALQGTTADFVRIAADRGPRAQAARGIQRELDRARRRRLDPDRPLSRPDPTGPGLDLATIAGREGMTPLEVVLEIQRHGGAQAISFGMSEDDVREVMRHEFVATASDGSTHVAGPGDLPHPRAYGTFPRKIRYALDDKIMTLEAGGPFVLGPARRDPGTSRPGHPARRGHSPTSSSSTRRRSAMRRRSSSRRASRRG